MEQEKNASQKMLSEIAKLVSMKRSFLIETLENLISGMQSEYGSVLNQKEIEIALLRSKEEGHLKDIQGLIDLKNDLLASLEIEAKSHKRTLEMLSARDRQNDEQKKEMDLLRDKIAEGNSIMAAFTTELQAKGEQVRNLQEANKALTVENELAHEKYTKMKGFIDKGGGAYSQTLKQVETDRLARAFGDSKNRDTYTQNEGV